MRGFLAKFTSFTRILLESFRAAGFAFSSNLKQQVSIPGPQNNTLKETSLEATPLTSSPTTLPALIDSNSTHQSQSSTDQNIPVIEEIKSNLVRHERVWEQESFWAYLDSFVNIQNSAHTKRAYEKDLVDFLAYLKAADKAMTVHTLVAYRDTLANRVSDRTGGPLSRVSINRKIATIKSFLNWLVLNGVIPNNPAKAVKSYRAGRDSPTRDIPDDLVRRMLSLPNRHKTSGTMHHAMLTVLFHLGLRRSELVDLKTSDLFERDGMRVIRVRGKGDKERVLPLTAEVAKSIDTYLHIARKDASVDQPLFTPVKNNVTKTKDKPLHPNAVAYVVKYYAKLAGVSYRVSPHSARATAVSNALDHHAPHRAVQHMAGWSSPLMVTRYDKRKEELRNSGVRFVKYEEDDADDILDVALT